MRRYTVGDMSSVQKAAHLVELATAKAKQLTTAESCTGGLVAAAITGIAGASKVFELGFITYSNASKNTLLKVDAELLARHGAVSQPVAAAMAASALTAAVADLALAVTGIAGPDGSTPDKPVGTVYIAIGTQMAKPMVAHHRFTGDRQTIRQAALDQALTMMIAALEDSASEKRD